MINVLSDPRLSALLNAVNKCWAKNTIPNEWRHIEIVPIPTARRNFDELVNYRPFSLISVLMNITNFMARERLVLFSYTHNLLSDPSFDH